MACGERGGIVIWAWVRDSVCGGARLGIVGLPCIAAGRMQKHWPRMTRCTWPWFTARTPTGGVPYRLRQVTRVGEMPWATGSVERRQSIPCAAAE